ncbi:MAG: DUF2067 family protein [Desulfurococcaceae archaeon]
MPIVKRTYAVRCPPGKCLELLSMIEEGAVSTVAVRAELRGNKLIIELQGHEPEVRETWRQIKALLEHKT